MSIELRISFFPFLSMSSSCTPMWMWVYSRGHPFFVPPLSHPLFRLVELNSSADGWSNCGCLAVIPRHKGRTKFISILIFCQFWVALLINRYVYSRSTIIPELVGWLQLFSLFVFVFSLQGLISFVERLQIRLLLFCTTFSMGRKPSHSKIFEL
jgi:hypothetical protein